MKEVEIKCKYLELEGKQKVSPEDLKQIFNIVRNELSFLVRNNIPPLPKQYSRWFKIFCYLAEKQEELDDLEIKGLYKKLYDDYQEESIPKNVADRLRALASRLDNTLSDFVNQIDSYDTSLSKHQENIEISSKAEDTKEILSNVKRILSELENIRSQNKELKAKINEYHEEIRNLKEELAYAKSEAEIDFLTGLPNRRRFIRALEDALKDFKEKGYPFSIILLDIDDFKKINDTYGHMVGDVVLKELSYVLKFYLRANTIVGRLGGEEFAVLLPGVELDNAKNVAERIRKILENRRIYYKDEIIRITASFGVTQVKPEDTIESILERADKALYKAKEQGKNKVIVLQ